MQLANAYGLAGSWSGGQRCGSWHLCKHRGSPRCFCQCCNNKYILQHFNKASTIPIAIIIQYIVEQHWRLLFWFSEICCSDKVWPSRLWSYFQTWLGHCHWCTRAGHQKSWAKRQTPSSQYQQCYISWKSFIRLMMSWHMHNRNVRDIHISQLCTI